MGNILAVVTPGVPIFIVLQTYAYTCIPIDPILSYET